MNAKLVVAALLLVTPTASAGCNKDQTSPSPGPAAATSAPPVTVESLPARAEEEQKANQEITPDNYKAQLDQLEKEIGNP